MTTKAPMVVRNWSVLLLWGCLAFVLLLYLKKASASRRNCCGFEALVIYFLDGVRVEYSWPKYECHFIYKVSYVLCSAGSQSSIGWNERNEEQNSWRNIKLEARNHYAETSKQCEEEKLHFSTTKGCMATIKSAYIKQLIHVLEDHNSNKISVEDAYAEYIAEIAKKSVSDFVKDACYLSNRLPEVQRKIAATTYWFSSRALPSR